MLTKVISLGLLASVLSCSALIEERKVGSCTVVDDPVGSYGTLKVNCPELNFTLLYDNSPDGRDPLIFKIEGVDGERIQSERIEPFSMKTGDGETLSGWAYREEWRVGGHQLTAHEYFVNGGTSCYEEEERAVIKLHLKDSDIMLLNYYWEETDCGGA